MKFLETNCVEVLKMFELKSLSKTAENRKRPAGGRRYSRRHCGAGTRCQVMCREAYVEAQRI